MPTKIEVRNLVYGLLSAEAEALSPLLSRLNDGEDPFKDSYPSNIIEALHERTRLPKGLLEDIVYIIYRMEPPEFDRTDSRDSELYHKALEVCKTRTPLVLLSWFCKQLENC